MKIKVKHSGFSDHCWYNKFVGQEFEYITEDEDNYWVKTGDKMGSIEKVDCEIIKEEISTHPILQEVLIQQKTEVIKSREFPTGAKRDSNVGKPRPDLIHWTFLEALGKRLALGAEKYGENNYQKGIPNEVAKESLMRHIVAIMADRTDEDHLSAAAANIMFLIYNRDK